MGNRKTATIGIRYSRIFYPIVFLLISTISFAQVATIDITNINSTVMNNTKLLFGITFDSRTSLIGNTGIWQFGYYDTSGVIIPAVNAVFNDFPMSSFRYPGNGIGVGFDWKKSIGPVNSRPNQDLLGTLGSPQPVKFGFDEFMGMVEAKGIATSEVQIMVPIYDITTSGLTLTQSRAAITNVISNNADWVEYCNAPNDSSNPGGGIDWAAQRATNGHPAPYNVEIWNIGNEPWSGYEFGPTADSCNSYLTYVTPIIDAMLAIDPTIKITMPTTGNATNPLNWSYALLNSNLVTQGKVYALSQHYFPTETVVGSNPPAQGVSAVNSGLNSLITVANTKNVKVFVGDYAHYITSNNPSTAQKDSAMQWLGANLETDFLLMLSQKSTIERANFWTYGNAQAVWHPIRYNAPGNYSLLPAAEIYKILFPLFLDKSITVSTTSPTGSDGNPYSVRSNAFVSNDLMYMNILAVNRDKSNSVPLQISGTSGYSLNNARLLTATSLNSESIIENSTTPDISGDYTLPPMSVLILEYDNAALNTDNISINQDNTIIYPNPTNGILSFSKTLRNIDVINVYGQKVLTKMEPTSFISTQGLPAGTYFLKSDESILKFVIK